MLSLKAVAFAGFHHRGQGKDTGINALSSIRKCGVFSQLLASGCKKDIALCPLQKFNGSLGIRHINGLVLIGSSLPQHTPVLQTCVLAGCADIFRNLCSVRMGCVQNHFRLFLI